MRRGLLIGLMCCAAGCDDPAAEGGDVRVAPVTDAGTFDGPHDALAQDAQHPDASPDGPSPDAAPPNLIDPPRPANAEPVFESPVTGLVILGDAPLFSTEDTLFGYADEPFARAVIEAPLVAAAPVDGGALVVLGDALWGLDDQGLLETPVAARTTGVGDFAAVDGAVWIAAHDTLFELRAGAIGAVHAGDLPVAGAQIAAGRFGGDPALWVAAEDQLYALQLGDAPQAWPILSQPVTALAADATGAAWVVADGLWRIEDGVANPVDLPGVIDVGAHPDSAIVWLQTDDALWQARDGRLAQRTGAPHGILAVDPAGAAWIGSPSGLAVVRPGQFVQLRGLADGADLLEAVSLTIAPTAPDSVSAVTGGIDGVALALDGPPWVQRVDPSLLDHGVHTFAVTVDYEDGDSISASLHFVVPEIYVPTWDEDIEPLFVQQCDLCHGPRGNAHRMETIEVWRDEIDDILDAVRAARMPLEPNPPLSPTEIQTIADWQAAGTPESP